MSQDQFVHLHVHSEYSLLDGLSRIKDLAARAKTLNMPALALTDHGTMYGTIPFYRACKAAGVKPIIGVETYVASRKMTDKDPNLDRERFHLLLLAQNQTGYLNLLKIASASQLDGHYYRPRIDHDFLAAHSDGLIATTGCLAAEVPRAISQGQPSIAHRRLGTYLDIFGPERFFVELQDHEIDELRLVNNELLQMAGQYNLRFLATNDVHYTTAAEANPHDVLLCIQTSSSVKDARRLRLSDNGYYLKSYDEMHQLFGHVPGALENSLVIAEMCDVNLDFDGYHLPLFDVPDGHTPHSYLRHLCERGLAWRYGAERAASDELRHRLNHELTIINEMGFDTYFLIVWDLCEFARRADIWWNVRGSGAGSLVAYSLGITGIDPLANNLIFERFLNPGRVSMPDIDLDYPDDRRHEMVEYALSKYGSDKVAQIITFGTLGARAAIRDVGRAIDMPLPEVDEIARMIPAIPGKPARIENVLDKDHEFYNPDLDARYKESESVRELIDTARNLEGVARHASTHAAGVIISDKPLVEYLPLHRPTSGAAGLGGIEAVTQWPMEIVESIGLLKVDFLGLSTLTVMRRAVQLIEQRHGVRYTMENIPYDVGHVGPDPAKKPEALFELLGHGDVLGVFQVEGAGMRRLMMEMKPHRFDHIIAAISLYRPGPMENIPEYIARMHGHKEVTYHHEALEPILRDTYGILVYQEQIIRIASEIAGYAPGDADTIRKAVGKKIKHLLDKHKNKFITGGAARGYPASVCEAIWADIEFFARYGFNKAHAADYAVITCQTAFLKAHYPVEYMTALLSVERNNTEKVALYLADARRMGIDVAPPEINGAGLDFTIEPADGRPVIRYGLGAIKNAGEGAIQLLLDEREGNGRFRNLQELCDRVDLRRVGKRALESMIKVGVFDNWGTRPQLLDALDRLIAYSGQTHDAAAAGQMSLFGGLGGSNPTLKVKLLRPADAVEKIDHRQLLDWEKELIGVYLSEHPLERKLATLRDFVSATTAELDEHSHGKVVSLAGLISYVRTHTTKRGDQMAFSALEDLHGRVDLILFPRTWREFRDEVKVDQIVVVWGKVQAEGESLTIIVDKVRTKLQRNGDGDAAVLPPAPVPFDLPMRAEATAPAAEAPDELARAHGHQATPPPPDDDFFWPDGALLAEPAVAPVEALATIEPAPPATAVPETPTASTAAAAPAQPNGTNGHSNGRNRVVTVDIDPTGNWREACRRSLEIAAQFEGDDALSLRLVGQQLTMDFPNQRTLFCPELATALEQLPGVQRVYQS